MRGLRAKGSGLTASTPIASAQALSPRPSALALRPLLKWAGGKRQLLPCLRRFYPPAFNRYIEPFFGSGFVSLVRRIAPAVPLYAGAAALLVSALGIWWWAERDAAL